MFPMLYIGMEKEVIYLEIEPKLKEKVRKFADADRRSMTSLILLIIDKFLKEKENAR